MSPFLRPFGLFQYSNNDTHWGALTLSLTFVPSVLHLSIKGGFSEPGLISNKVLGSLLFLLPGIQLLNIIFRGSLVFKCLVSEYKTRNPNYKARREFRVCAINGLKIYEAIGEALPQSILQMSIILKSVTSLSDTWNHIATDFWISPMTSLLSVIISSLFSAVSAAGTMMTESSFHIDNVKITPHFSSIQTTIHKILMIPVVIPRIFTIALIFASFDGYYAAIPMTIFGTLYLILSFLICYCYRNGRGSLGGSYFSGRTVSKVCLMVITSILMPCRIIHPKWNLLILLSTLSATLLSITLASLMITSQSNSGLLKDSMMEDIHLYQSVCGVLIGCLVVGSFITALQVFLVRRNHQSFLFQCIYGNTWKVKRMLRAKNKYKYDYNERNGIGYDKNALDLAQELGNRHVVELIKKYGQDCGIEAPVGFYQ